MMRRLFAVVAIVAMLAPGVAMAQATPEARPDAIRRDSWVSGPALALFPESMWDSSNGMMILGRIPTYNGEGVAVLFQNPLPESVREVNVVIQARTSSGQLIAVAEIDGPGLVPTIINHGELGFGVANFGDVSLGDDVKFSTDWTYYPSSGGMYGHTNLQVTSDDHIDDRIVGEIHNPSPADMTAVLVDALCFDHSGVLEASVDGSAAGNLLQGHGNGVFQIDLDQDLECATYLITAHGVPE